MERKTMLLIFNPKAGLELFRQNLFEVIDKFTANRFLVTAYPTHHQRDAYEAVTLMGSDFDYLVCSGGDGTLNEVVDGLMNLDVKPVFGYIPSGTTNDFAHSVGIPDDVLHAADVICNGEARPIDVGKFQGDYFSYVAAFGLFTDVSYGTPQSMKNLLGHAAYMLEGVKRLASIKRWHCRIDCDGEIIEGDFVFGMITNSMSIGGFRLPIEHEVKQGDGLFELILLKQVRRLAHLQDIIGAITGTNRASEYFIVRSARKITVTCTEPLDWTLDGEYGGQYEQTEIHVCQNALSLMMPIPKTAAETLEQLTGGAESNPDQA
ncbi:YegS/Rv2252/BmrU family lipid kinase [Ruminococcaceae bacterium OttesenSCG-928-L11]|nr:YegS/Rv2252/BmrU family lipid kinase [Ruminococcaceae bacterium OttesenSCG-928-L11]